ncbi:ion channel [Halobacillus trueperi]|uniref:Two pore domain potassium channel family protein n=1 Tax=Halobacillus trueperi TaxID=156205 RepID=A0A3D8VKG7_9BACI|nr:ion channel [Halobacillus trueperi]RDY69842.1 two pore domain potassium channel family protein [Halobacillus trueperi]REJ08178.1 two pore domain potassium channel family protein [Halobacillus trueperi]
MVQALFIVAVIFIAANLVYFFTNKTYRKSYFSTALFFQLFFVLTGVLLGFTVLYYLLSLDGVILVTSLSSREPVDPTFLDLLYFSGETLLSVGYGDMLPVGMARFFALLESGIGILLPTAYFLKAMDASRQKED